MNTCPCVVTLSETRVVLHKALAQSMLEPVAADDGMKTRSFPQRNLRLLSHGRKAWSAIGKLVQQARQFHFAVNFNRAAPEALPPQKFPDLANQVTAKSNDIGVAIVAAAAPSLYR